MPAAAHTQQTAWTKRNSSPQDDTAPYASVKEQPPGVAMAPSAAATNSMNNTNTAVVPAAAGEHKVRVGELYWKQDGAYGWTLGQVVALHDDVDADNGGGVASTTTTTAKWISIDETSGEARDFADFPPQMLALDECPLYPANPLFTTASDMTSLRHLHEAALAKNLEDRASLQNLRPYTFMANVLIAMNPLKRLEEPDKALFIGQPLDRCPPHPYNIAENAYRQLCAVRAVMQNQSIIISGESGSGKTETSKIILDFLTQRASHGPARSASASEDEMEPELTMSVAPMSATMALSYPHSNNSSSRKLSPIAVGERLMETIPILESFGNAKTHRNDNSSRFGKYMRLQFSTGSHELTGASIDTYLLEKSRLVSQPMGERNFHIFYELLHSAQDQYIEESLHLKPKDPSAYEYLNQSGCMEVEGINDAKSFQKLCKALEFVGIRDDAQDEIFRLVAGLLHLGNVKIGEEDTSEGKTACISEGDTESEQALRYAAELLGVTHQELNECILLKRIMTRGTRRGSIYYAKRDARNAIYSRDTIAKTIYEHTFTWLMLQCASALDYDSFRSDVIPYIGVLDIFGFEDFEPKNRNSFEQLLINYANEALQSLFNSCIFEAEQELYRSEHIFNPINHSLSFPFPLPGVEMKTRNPDDIDFLKQEVSPSEDVVQYSDNRECLNLISSRHGGLFVTIDNVSRLPMPSDRKLNERLHNLFKRNPCFPAPHPKDIRDTFMIRHYAGTVTYTIASFVDKNNNIISDQFEELIKRSTSRVLQELNGRNRSNSQNSQSSKTSALSNLGSSKRLKGGSTSNLFSTQMKGLTTELEGTSCNFVRCIKPNTQMKAGIFDKPFVVEQLRCSGTVQACEVLRVGLPTRILYAEVVDVYKPMLPPEIFARFESNEKLFTQAILHAYDFPTSAYRLGDTRLFFRTGKIDLLDKLLTPSQESTEKLPSQIVHYVVKKRWMSATTTMITFNIFKRIFQDCKYKRKATIIQCMVRQHLARKRLRKLRVLHRISKVWNRMAHQAQIMHAYQDLPDHKMVLLDKLLKKNYLPPRQRWLLKWLGPLQKVIYLQKLWKKVMTQYLAKRAFLWLFETVKRKRSVVLVQVHARVLIAKAKFRRLKKARLARERWRMAYVKVKTFCMFTRQFQKIHVVRLESDNQKLYDSVAATNKRLETAEQEAREMREKYEKVQMQMESTHVEIVEQATRIMDLESELECAHVKIADLRQKSSGGLLERAIRFFTCSSAASPPEEFPQKSMNPGPVVILRKPIELKPRERLPSETVVDAEDEEMKAKDADVLYSVSRYCF